VIKAHLNGRRLGIYPKYPWRLAGLEPRCSRPKLPRYPIGLGDRYAPARLENWNAALVAVMPIGDNLTGTLTD
jgi:hypothetical protein